MRLKDKVGIITGAGSGIGRAIAITFAREGAKTVILDRAAEGLEATAAAIGDGGGECITVHGDVSNMADLEQMVREGVGKFGRIDILVNNAGIEEAGSLEGMSEEQWDRLMGINLKAYYFGCKLAIPEMRKVGKGKIINISSLAAVVGAPLISLYSTAKAGIIGMTRCLAAEFAPYNINVNAICPGFIETGMTHDVLELDVMRSEVIDRTPMERIGDPDRDIAPAAVFFASDESDFVTGQFLVIDGGYSVI